PKTEEGRASWSPDSTRIAYQSRPKDKAAYELDVMEIATRKTTHITQNTPEDQLNSSALWSRDGKYLAWTREWADEKNSDVMIVDLATGKVDNLTNHGRDQLFSVSAWAPDGK